MRYSSTFFIDPDMKIGFGSTLLCDCGANYTLKKLPVLTQFNDKGELFSRSYCCKKCLRDRQELVILLEDKYEPPLSQTQQSNEADPRRGDAY